MSRPALTEARVFGVLCSGGVTIVWSMAASACLTLAGMHFPKGQ